MDKIAFVWLRGTPEQTELVLFDLGFLCRFVAV